MSVITHYIHPHNAVERIIEQQVRACVDLLVHHDDSMKLLEFGNITVWTFRRKFVHMEVSRSDCCVCGKYKRLSNSKLCVNCKSQKSVLYDWLFVGTIPAFYKRWFSPALVETENARKKRDGKKILDLLLGSIGEDPMAVVMLFLFHVDDEPLDPANLKADERALSRQYKKMTRCKRGKVPEFNFCPGHGKRDILCYEIIDANGSPSSARDLRATAAQEGEVHF